jgi:cobalt-zinc-cadmium efflux system protein
MGAGHHHGHSHGHGHAADDDCHGFDVHPGSDAVVRRALLGSLILNGLFFVIELGVGLWSGSLALLSDAAHMLSDVGALVLALGAAHLASRAASEGRSFGFRRAEPLGAFVNGLTLLAACGWILWEASQRLREGPPAVAGMAVLVVGVIGLGINLGSAWMLYRSDRENLNVRGALMHMLADALGSVGAIVAALFLLAGQPLADPLVSVLIAVLVLYGTWHVLRDSTVVLLQFAPPGMDIPTVRERVLDVPGVIGMHDLHIWTLDGRRAVLSAHLQVDDPASLDAVREEATDRLATLGIHHVTLQIERDGCSGGCPEDHAA